jgi:hypothetical protein
MPSRKEVVELQTVCDIYKSSNKTKTNILERLWNHGIDQNNKFFVALGT